VQADDCTREIINQEAVDDNIPTPVVGIRINLSGKLDPPYRGCN
jgi:hypothetical protein